MHLLTTAVVCVAILGVGAGPAEACTCVGGVPPAKRLADAEVGFVGTVLSRRSVGAQSATPGFGRYAYLLRVERTYKGSLPAEVEITMGGGSASCGMEPLVGSRLGLLLYGSPPYSAGICNVIAQEDLERAVRPPAPPLGRGRVALLAAGRFGERTRVAALDRRGRVIAYGFGGGGAALSVCPGSRVFVQAGDALVVRRMRDLRALSRRRLAAAAADVRCLDAGGRTVVVLAHAGPRGTDRAVVLLRGGRERVLARGLLPYASLGQRRAVVTRGSEGDVRVSAVDYASGRTRPLLRLADAPWGLALDPGERLLAVSATDPGSLVAGPRPRVIVRDLRTGSLLSRAVDDLRPGRVLWLSARRFAVMGWVAAEASIYDARDLSLAGRLQAIETPAAARLGGAVVGVERLGYLVRSVPGAPALARIALLPTSEVATLVAVPGAPALRGASRAVPRAAAAAACPH